MLILRRSETSSSHLNRQSIMSYHAHKSFRMTLICHSLCMLYSQKVGGTEDVLYDGRRVKANVAVP